MLEKGCCELWWPKKTHSPLKRNVLLMCVYLSAVGIHSKETKGPRWQVNEHPPVVPLIPREQEEELTNLPSVNH